MIKQNMHIHSKYSWDCEQYGKMEIEEIARILYENGIKYGAITDHVEFDREPLPLVLTKLKIRNLEIDEANKKYGDKVKLLKAVEISEPHLYKDKVETLAELDLDLIMGSVHQIDRNAKTESEKTHATYLYYIEMMKMIEANQIDVVGHLDYIRRIYPDTYYSPNQISELLHAIKEHNLVMEMNTSANRRTGLFSFPSPMKLAHYKIIGGNDITIGTDAHQYSELTDNLEQAEAIIDEIGLNPVIYQKRKRINL